MDKENVLNDSIDKLCKKLDMMINGNIVNDTLIKHFKNTARNLSKDNKAIKVLMDSGIKGAESELILLSIVMMNAGPLPKEDMTEEFKQGVEMFKKEHSIKVWK